MDRTLLPEIPADLATVTDGDQIASWSDHVRSHMGWLREQPLTDDSIAALRSARGEFDRLAARAVEITASEDALAAEADVLTEGIDDEPAAAGETGDGDPADGEDGEPVDDDAEAAAAVEPAAEPGGPVEVVEAPAPELVPAAAETQTAAIDGRQALQRLRTRHAQSAAASVTTPRPEARTGMGMYAAADLVIPGERTVRQGEQFTDARDFAGMVAGLRARMGRTTVTGRTFEYVGSMRNNGATDEAILAPNDPIRNFASLSEAGNSRLLARQLTEGFSADTLVASGCLCPPDNPFYDYFRLAEPQSPVEQALPVRYAPRGVLRYIKCVDWRAARAAIGTRTAEENCDPATPPKPCATVTCPPIDEVAVTAVSECVRFDNLFYRAFPEVVENFMLDVAVNHAAVKECMYLASIDSTSTPTTVAVPGYGASRSLFHQLRAAASGYRKRHNMGRDAVLQWYAPSWLPDLLVTDMANDHSLGLSFLDITPGRFNQIFTNLGISPVWYYDEANCTVPDPGTGQSWRKLQAAGALNQWPSTTVSYLFAPGTYVRLDSGSLDVGLVRDSQLNGTNDLELFQEEWVGMLMLGCESIKMTHTLCPNGTAPEPVAEFACT